MDRVKVLGLVLTALVMFFMFSPIASAQQYPEILHGQWFKAKVGMKLHKIGFDREAVVGKWAGGISVYLHFTYNDVDTSYTIATCMQDDGDELIWHKNSSDPIRMDVIYGTTYPELWLLAGGERVSLVFENDTRVYAIIPIFYTKISGEGSALKNATISNVECMMEGSVPDGAFGYGSCSLSGSLIPAAKVEAKVPPACLAP
jgi:hypothetical protein